MRLTVALLLGATTSLSGGCGAGGCEEVTMTITPVVIPAAGADGVVLSVRVTNEEGEPISGFRLGLSIRVPEHANPTPAAHGATDARGEFRAPADALGFEQRLERGTDVVAYHGDGSSIFDDDESKYCETETSVPIEHERGDSEQPATAPTSSAS